MKIDGQTSSELLQRMQELHQEATESASGPSGAAQAQFSVGTEAVASPESVGQTSSLQSRIETEATRALSGDYADDAQIRGAVIEAILDERLSEGVSAADRRKMESRLKDALIDDPNFIQQVDDMLLLAARELANRR